MAKTAEPTKIDAAVVLLPPPLDRFFGGNLAGAVSPAIVLLYGPSGVGKSQMAMRLAYLYHQRGWNAIYTLTEQSRLHTGLQGYEGITPIFVQPSRFLDYTKEAAQTIRTSQKPTVWVVDSVATITDGEAIAARYKAFCGFVRILHEEIPPSIPVVVIAIAQARQKANPMAPTMPGKRPSLSESSYHLVHAVVRLERKKEFTARLDEWSALLLRVGQQGLTVSEFNPSFHPKQEIAFEWGEISLPENAYFVAEVQTWGIK